MNDLGKRYNIAPMEMFLGVFGNTREYQRVYRTLDEASLAVFWYVVGFCNQRRLHLSLGYLPKRPCVALP
jgi:transposase InsO family protein